MDKTGSNPKFTNRSPLQEEPALLELFAQSLRELYWAENHLVKTLPKMALASSSRLAGAIEEHLEETKMQVSRLEEIFHITNQKMLAQKCEAMECLTKEGEILIESTDPGTATRDVAVIMASQKVEHHEIACYGTLAQLAKTLGLEETAALLEQSLEEEKAADVKLTEIAENDVNYEATMES
ncbi:protein of unknown function DUF892 [Pseudopedobacter saltans DSM 12145]|uniref:Uncharacterized protein n=1 Tax=Pseudopedobacter saltans (strain ATCC 51119 / DSM 12145 / JCM 21818 / CCUG 39354 / LMG 10337 / NBRC 100064 / NCIMB 13643) TaxID=762903 RepID=F0SCD6_PSESL|nr:ferritin-like domain-containing protein [Pseudopedobacter saltans]ADY51733.1 protein of unknown function DUF892 [Pseudopedobacter saltans DSM 12145]